MEPNKSEYSLSIRFSSDGFSLSVLDRANTVILTREVRTSLFQLPKRELLNLFAKELEFVSADYKNISLIVETDHYVFVPASVFDLKNLDHYFYFQHKPDERQVVLFNRTPKWDGVNIFSVPAELNEALSEFFPDWATEHQMTYFLSEKLERKDNHIAVWVRPDKIDLVVLKENQLHLVNSFSYRTAEDLAYFVLNCLEQFNLNIEKAEVKLYQRDKNREYKNMLSMYVKHCDIMSQ